ncbi:MAG: double-strand break repair protein AddB [Shimia sp.]
MDSPRLFHVPLGYDFPAELVSGLRARHPGAALGRVTLLLNSERMRRRVRACFDAGPPSYVPRLRLVTDLAALAPLRGRAETRPVLRRVLDLAPLLAAMRDGAPDLSTQASLFELGDMLVKLLSEMEGEAVPPSALATLETGDRSGHWERARALAGIAADYAAAGTPSAEAAQRALADRLAALWAEAAPRDPVVVAGSTASRGTTSVVMQAVARLPNGAVVLPGIDPNLPQSAWDASGTGGGGEDHPQARFFALRAALGLSAGETAPWTDARPAAPERARVLSLALRPAPVTNQWLAEGPALPDLAEAMSGVTLLEARDDRAEAETIALRLRAAAEAGIQAALVTPDRTIARRVTAALARWGIVPDDSAGQPLPLTPPGRLLLQSADAEAPALPAEELIALLKHPLVASGGARGDHLRFTRDLELRLRAKGPPFVDAAALRDWGSARAERADWVAWLAGILEDRREEEALDAALARHRDLAERLCSGPNPTDSAGAGGLWDREAGRATRAAMEALWQMTAPGDALHGARLSQLLRVHLTKAQARQAEPTHPDIAILGTLEARATGARLVVLAGLNEGTWPAQPAPDPWLNREMRRSLGLPLPDRQIGLSAHDFEQAASAPEVWLVRAERSGGAPTVPSRWLNRLTNLLSGLPERDGEEALRRMRARAAPWIAEAARLDAGPPVPPATRPAPIPPPEARPKRLSITAFRTLARDPYAIYARSVLRLHPLAPLAASADARLRGIAGHDVMEALIKGGFDPFDAGAEAAMVALAQRVLADKVPWHAARRLWAERLRALSPAFVSDERARRADARPAALEEETDWHVPGTDMTITGKVDRIDLAPDGTARVYDYKSGRGPTEDEQRHFDRQLQITALMVADGAFSSVTGPGGARVTAGRYLSLAPGQDDRDAVLDPAGDMDDLREVIAIWSAPDKGFTARRAMFKVEDVSDYDHLARYGEWQVADAAVPMRVPDPTEDATGGDGA